MAKALAEHNWVEFLEILDLPEAILKKLRPGDEAALFSNGLMSIYKLCSDKSIRRVVPVRSYYKDNIWIVLNFYGVTPDNWLRPGGGLYAADEVEFRGPLFTEDEEAPASIFEGAAPDASRTSKIGPQQKAHLPRMLNSRLACIDHAPNPLDAFVQCGGIVLAKFVHPADRERGASGVSADEEKKAMRDVFEPLEAFHVRGAVGEPDALISLPFAMLSNDLMLSILLDLEHDGKRHFSYYASDSVLLQEDWPAMKKALEGWMGAQTGDEQVEYARGLLNEPADLVAEWALSALRSMGLGQRPLDEAELSQFMDVVRKGKSNAAVRLDLFLLLLPGSWDELRDKVLPVVEELKLDEDGIESVVGALSKLPESPEVENVIKALKKAYADK